MKSFLISSLLSFVILTFSANLVFSQALTPSSEPEIIYPQGSYSCTDFDITVESSSQRQITDGIFPAEGESHSSEDNSGNLDMKNSNFLDFKTMEEDLGNAIDWLTPQELLDKLKIEGPSLNSKAKHFVQGKDENGNLAEITDKTNIPSSEITYPSWYTSLIGKTKWLCGIFGTCPAAKSPNIQIQQADVKISDEAYKKICALTNENAPIEENERTSTTQSVFSTSNWWRKVTNIISKITNEFTDFFVKTEKKATFTAKTRTELAGGKNFEAYSDFQKSYLPANFFDEWEIKTGPLASKDNNYDVNVAGFQSSSSQNLTFSEEKKVQFQRCMTLCSIYPAGTDISQIDPVCPSTCDYTDYEFPYIQVDKTNCHPQPGGGCDYKNDTASASCDGDPICESGKCYPNMYRMIGDYVSNGCTPPYPGNGCTIPEVCVSMTFKKNPAGGFGPCQYENPNVCVRADWKDSGVGICDYLCNWACCAYQK